MAGALRGSWPFWLVGLAWALTLGLGADLAAGPPRWLSAHVLSAFRGYDTWGVWATLGANLVLPPTPETVGIDLRALTKGQGAYLTYPSLWTLALYLPYAWLGHPVAPASWLMGAGLVLVRGGGAWALCAVVRELATIWGVTPARAGAVGTAVAVAWLASPPVLYYSRDELFADQFVLPACSLATWATLRARGRLAALTPGLRAALVVGGLGCWGTEWLGWVTMTLVAAAFLAGSWAELPGDHAEARVGSFVRRGGVLLVPAAIVIAGYLAQLTWYADGWSQLLGTFQRRALMHATDEGIPLALDVMLRRIAGHVAAATPGPWAWAPLLALPALALAWPRVPDRRLAGAALALVLLPPLLHTALLLQHATLHPFSGLKFAGPLWLLALGLPLIAGLQRTAWAALGGLAAAGLLATARPALVAYVPPPTPAVAQLRDLVAAQVPGAALAVSDQIFFDTMKAHAAWSVPKLVRHPDDMAAIAPKLRPGALTGLPVVALAFAGAERRSALAPLAAGRWRAVPQRMDDRAIVVATLPVDAQGFVRWWAARQR